MNRFALNAFAPLISTCTTPAGPDSDLTRANGVTQQELVGAITHLAFDSGWPNAVTAVGVAREVFDAETQPRQ
ncbi:MAG TPA: carboxymuconolactone decarboxylase family protein [Thermoanaerobaculia bacterium]|jgi:hypothetical protein